MIYGYLWDEKREHWLVDEEAAEVVRRIFSLTLEGYGPVSYTHLFWRISVSRTDTFFSDIPTRFAMSA